MDRIWAAFIVVVLAGGVLIHADDVAGCRPAEVPVTVVLSDGRPVLNLSPNGFVAKSGGKTVNIRGVESVSDPRRIGIVLDDSRDLKDEAWSAVQVALQRILGQARKEDAFALITAHGYDARLRFGSAPQTIEQQFQEITAKRKAANNTGPSVFDAIAEMATWFGTGQPGDAILVLASNEDDMQRRHGKTGFDKLSELLTEHSIRVFGIQFGMVLAGEMYWSGPLFGGARNQIRTSGVDVNREHLGFLSQATGGFLHVEVTDDPQHEYRLTDPVRSNLEQAAWRIYESIVQYYELQIDSSPTELDHKLVIDLAPQYRAKLPKAVAFYPRSSIHCANTSN